MSIDIDPAGLCDKCRTAHEQLEFNLDKKIPVQPGELCDECKEKYGLLKKPEPAAVPAEGDTEMKHKRKYTRRADKEVEAVKPGKKVRLDRETKKFIKHLAKSAKKAGKLEAKALKHRDKADALDAEAASLRVGMEALKDAVNEA
jgi:hypothetical protein